MALPRTIAIDGPAGSGKSTVAFTVAQDLDYLFVDTGAFYRGVTLAVVRTGLLNATESAVIKLTSECHLDITADLNQDNRQYTLLLNGEDVTWAIRNPQVEAHVSRISAISGVRAVLIDQQRALVQRGPVIMVGRDIGTVVLPDADMKIYLDASVEARAGRRYRQRLAVGEQADYQVILAGLQRRDEIDSQRPIAPLQRAADALYLNTDDMDVEAVVVEIERLISEWQPKNQRSEPSEP